MPVYKCVYIKCIGRSKQILGLIDLLASSVVLVCGFDSSLVLVHILVLSI